MVSVKVESNMKKAESSRVVELSEILIKWDPNGDIPTNLTDLGVLACILLRVHYMTVLVFSFFEEAALTIVFF